MSYHSFFSRPLSLKILNKLRAKNTGFKIKVQEYQYRLSKTPSMQDKRPGYQIVKVHH